MQPTIMPKPMPTIRASRILFVACRTRDTSIAVMAVTAPTVRSICPAAITKTPATAMTDIIAVCLRMLIRFLG